MDPVSVALIAMYGFGIAFAIARYARDKSRGDLSRFDGALRDDPELRFAPDQITIAGEAPVEVRVATCGPAPAVSTVPGFSAHYQKNAWRLRVAGLQAAQVAAFRLTKSSAPGATMDVQSTRADATRQLLDNSDVQAALRQLCGAKAHFAVVDLFPDGDLMIDCLPMGELEGAPHRDLVLRLIAFADALERAVPLIGQVAFAGSSSASGSPVSFSIQVRH